MLLLRQLKWLVAPGLTPAPVLPVIAFTITSSSATSVLPEVISPNWIQVAKHPRVCHMLAMTDGTTIQLGQAINKVVVITLDTIVHTEVDDFSNPRAHYDYPSNFFVSPWAVQKNNTSISSKGSRSVNTKSVSP